VIDTFLQRFPQTLELILADAEIKFASGDYEAVCKILHERLDDIKASMERVDAAKAHYIYGMSLIELGKLDTGVGYVIEARDEDPWNVQFKLGGIYAMVKCQAWDDAVQSLPEILRDENLIVSLTIDDFADLAYLFHVLRNHYMERNRHEAILICEKIIQMILKNHISRQSEIEKITDILNESTDLTEASSHV
jgi:tetratricopeptide (TPR) repeat protein